MTASVPAHGQPDGGHWLSFELDSQLYAAPLAQVSEVIRLGEVTPVPGSAPDLLGVRHLRGQIVPVMDGRARLGLAPAADPTQLAEQERVVVLRHANHWVGLRVDAVGDLLLPTDEALGPPPPDRAARQDDPVQQVMAWRGGFVAMLDVRRLCRLHGAADA